MTFMRFEIASRALVLDKINNNTVKVSSNKLKHKTS